MLEFQIPKYQNVQNYLKKKNIIIKSNFIVIYLLPLPLGLKSFPRPTGLLSTIRSSEHKSL